MPIYEYKCDVGHITEEFFLTFEKAKEAPQSIVCQFCENFNVAEKIEFSVPMPGHFYGDPVGYSKPSPTKRYSTKLVSQIEGNSNSMG